MMGLPTETDEDLVGIANIVRKIKGIYGKIPSRARALRVSVSVSTFIPKPFTPFQYEKQITQEEVAHKLEVLKKNGVNRISIGVESFNKYNLKLLNRKHDKKDVFEKIALCKELGFDNINVDLIYALPTEDMMVLRKDVSLLLKLDVDHISTYSLIIENNTALYNKKVKNINEELDAKMYKYICKVPVT